MAANRGAPKVGWCWARNPHTWLGVCLDRGRLTPGISGLFQSHGQVDSESFEISEDELLQPLIHGRLR